MLPAAFDGVWEKRPTKYSEMRNKMRKIDAFPKSQVGSMAMAPVPAGPSISPTFGHVSVVLRAMEKEGAAQDCHINLNSDLWGYLFEHSTCSLHSNKPAALTIPKK